jgi:hypothetical protein
MNMIVKLVACSLAQLKKLKPQEHTSKNQLQILHCKKLENLGGWPSGCYTYYTQGPILSTTEFLP